MTKKYTGRRQRVRITIGSADHYKHRPLVKAIVKKLEENRIFGVTVLRAVGGYGSHEEFHTDGLLSLSCNLPVVIEFVDYHERIEYLLPELDPMIESGMITMEEVDVIFYRAPHPE